MSVALNFTVCHRGCAHPSTHQCARTGGTVRGKKTLLNGVTRRAPAEPVHPEQIEGLAKLAEHRLAARPAPGVTSRAQGAVLRVLLRDCTLAVPADLPSQAQRTPPGSAGARPPTDSQTYFTGNVTEPTELVF